MSEIDDLPASEHHIIIADEDWKFLDERYGKRSESRIGVSQAIRLIIHSKCREMRAAERKMRDQMRDAESNIDMGAAP